MRAALRLAFVACLPFLCAVCLPSYVSPDDGGSDSAAPEGGPATEAGADTGVRPDDGGADAARDSTTPPPGDAEAGALTDAEAGTLTGPHAAAQVGNIQSETGNAQQHHLVFARGDGRYWLFYIDADAHSLKTLASPDLATWTAGATLTLPQSHSSEGRNFSVAYAQLGGVDVIHVALALNDLAGRHTYHARATVAGGTLTWDTLPGALSSVADGPNVDNCDPDGPSVAIAQDGHVLHATGWNDSCDNYVFVSENVDTGGPWTPGLSAQYVAFVGWESHTRQMTALQGSDGLMAFDDGFSPQAPTNIEWSASTAGAWQQGVGGTDVFPDSGADVTFDDWSMCRRNALEIDLARRESLDGGPSYGHFEYYRLATTTQGFKAAEPLADDPGVPGTGLVTFTNGTSVLLFAIAVDYSIHYARWTTSGGVGSWSAWAVAVPAPSSSTRAYLAGTGCELTDHAVLLWTEGDQTFSVMALDVAPLF